MWATYTDISRPPRGSNIFADMKSKKPKILINNIDEEDMADLWTLEGDSKFTRFTLKGRYEQIFVEILKETKD